MHYDAAYQGAPGAFSEEAALRALASLGRAPSLLPCTTFEEVFDAVCAGRAGRGVVPVENSLAGPVRPVVSLLEQRGVRVTSEFFMRIDQTLIGLPGATVSSLRRIHSHPVALAQCKRFFADNPHIACVEAFDTAGAVAEVVRAGLVDDAAIGPRRAADVYGGVVLAEQIQDSFENRTWFAVIEVG